jgi:hypothetical protein
MSLDYCRGNPGIALWGDKRLTSGSDMELVSFISCELDETDMIVSFAVHPSEDSVEVESLTLMRTPKYEIVLDEWKRGASVRIAP